MASDRIIIQDTTTKFGQNVLYIVFYQMNTILYTSVYSMTSQKTDR